MSMFRDLVRHVLVSAALALGTLTAQAETPREKTVIGRVEEIAIMPEGFVLRAKVDSGARTSSLNARGYTLFNREGRKWVRFTVTNAKKESMTLERPVTRIARIKRIQGKSQERPVIMLKICLGRYEAETEVNLVDRTGFNYQFLIGRRYMEGRFVIDPARGWTKKPACPAEAAR
jgi:hypothetical protein